MMMQKNRPIAGIGFLVLIWSAQLFAHDQSHTMLRGPWQDNDNSFFDNRLGRSCDDPLAQMMREFKRERELQHMEYVRHQDAAVQISPHQSKGLFAKLGGYIRGAGKKVAAAGKSVVGKDIPAKKPPVVPRQQRQVVVQKVEQPVECTTHQRPQLPESVTLDKGECLQKKQILARIIDQAAPLRAMLLQDLATEYAARARIEKLLGALDRSFDGDVYSATILMSDAGKDFLCDNNYAPDTFDTLYGTPIQHCFQQELLDILDLLIEQRDIVSTPLNDFALDCTLLGFEANRAALLEATYQLANFGWGVVTGIEGALEGPIFGVMNVAQMVLHPIDTITTLAQATGMLCRHVCEVTRLLQQFEDGVDPDGAFEKLIEYHDQTEQIISTLIARAGEMSCRDIGRSITGSITEGMLISGLCNKAVKACTSAVAIARRQSVGNLARAAGREFIDVAYEVAGQEMLAGEALAVEGSSGLVGIGSSAGSGTENVVPNVVGQMIPTFRDELAALQKVVHSLPPFKEQKLIFPYRHIFGYGKKKKIVDNIVTYRVDGFHHDYLLAIENSGLLFFKDKKVNPITKAYVSEVALDGTYYDTKTFFPSDWTRTKVIEEIDYSLRNLINDPVLAENNLWKYEGKTSDDIVIITFINKDSKIISSFPDVGSVFK